MKGKTDEQHLALAKQLGRVVFTHDQDYLALAARQSDHAGIAYVRHRAGVKRMIQGLVLIWEILEPEDMVGHVEFL